eukprot:Phypoly_transcript_06975.p1 GENE.Phypoly_transcript_06975~~Phypoly_transcript_06975.p1  ORF type:complete len:349 (+),score=42.25 Phypoly_transcript_06975:591-1637(+)
MHSHFPPVTATHQMHHSNFCSYCLKSLAPAKAALPDTFPPGHGLPMADRFWPKQEVLTCSECTVEKYCSESCKKVATAAYHHLMCIGPPPNREHPLVELQLQCMKYDTNYPILVARMLAMAATLFPKLNSKDEDALWEISPFSKFATSDQPLPAFDNQPELKEFVYEIAYELICEAMESQVKKYPKLFSQTRYWELFNAVYLNCSQIFPQSPFNVYMHHIAHVRPMETLQQCMAYIERMNKISAEILDLPAEESSEVIFHKLTKSAGCGMFSLHSQMNHSCNPNVKSVTQRSPSARLDVVALRPIDKGDEICIDYVGSANIADVSERRKLISEKYCFECKCPKCIAES